MFTGKHLLGFMTLATGLVGFSAYGDPQPIATTEFDQLQKLIKPAANESRWLGMDWLTSVHEARQLAAAEGKPILLWSGGGAAPLGGC